MYLMNAPTVAAPRTEWRACGPPGGFSLPVCFNDSDAELSSRGSISNKVQMIIESLRSTQSSLEMGDETEENQDAPPQACKAAVGSFAPANSKSHTTGVPSPIQDSDKSSDAESDDSVDKGIEEAILEYLKEKDGHKRKMELCSALAQSSKQTQTIPQVVKIKSESDTFSIMTSNFSKSATQAAPAGVPLKKYIKHKVILRDRATSPVNPNSLACKVKAENLSDDTSSSDDGIEEAIQRYQLERMEQQLRGEAFKPLVEDSDSSSDDGIEEAIRSYQLEQLKEKMSLPEKETTTNASTENANKHKLQKRKKRAEKVMKSVELPSSTLFKSSLDVSQRTKGNGLLSFGLDGFKDQPTQAPPKANTTAELMCAEAILDISKTVMPAAFVSHHSVAPSACVPAGSSRATPADESNDSSIDSEDGIEQEIMKFLEQKAQLVKQTPGCAAPRDEPETVTEKHKVVQKKPPGLSLTQRRKHQEENNRLAIMTAVDKNADKDASAKPSKVHRGELSPLLFSQRSQSQPLDKQTGDKSSSLDSDEDLDTAIKDLLKTKKTKRKTKSERNALKRPKEEEPPRGPLMKKAKCDPPSKAGILKKAHKRKSNSKDKHGLVKKTKANHTSKRPADTAREKDTRQIKEDSSSVDSDDSIEQEIRKFLAERAEKVSERTKDEEMPRNGAASLRLDNIKQENQLAEIPQQRISVLGQPLLGGPLTKAHQDKPVPQMPDNCAVGPQSRTLEAADGAGSARTEPSPPIDQVSTQQTERVESLSGASVDRSYAESVKWRQSFGLPIIDPKNFNQTPFYISLPKQRESPSAPSSHQGKGTDFQPSTQAPLWSPARTSRPPLSWSTDTTAKTPTASPVLSFFSTTRQNQGAFTSSGRPHRPTVEAAASTVHVPRDKSVFVELESGRTNHVQVQSRQSSEGKARADGQSENKSGKIDEKEAAEEEFIDESESESPEKKQSTLSLSSTIDPGIVFRPCIALSTEERRLMFRWRHQGETRSTEATAPADKTKHHVKRKLEFVPVRRSRVCCSGLNYISFRCDGSCWI
ncbi:protein phosphatase 1 regulatory subunit 26 [Dunckerocampus dactyliophorus]|uniref:protein phosphatase 1 regulatory subunit 26 n=1 Tax=Dunckerocampus dactyliophorus TaxID=161453 RepID=UPI002406C00D|nr:protein phosphatase 1 regulatory subunit 26 [Dunckerocampus dactyliophorus]